MKVVLSTIGKFHTFDLARQLERRDALVSIFTGYPRFKLRNESLPAHKIRTFPWLQAPYMRLGATIPALKPHWENCSAVALDKYVSRNMPECDVFCGISGSATRSGRIAKSRGIRYVCDRGSSHIRFQDEILREEHDRHNLVFPGIDVRAIAREESEYDMADAITVPSTFALNSFLKLGIRREKLRLAPYGVDLARFSPKALPDPKRFDVLFVGALSVQKGLPYLLKAFEKLEHKKKHLTLAGSFVSCPSQILQAIRTRVDVTLLGHVPQSNLSALMSASHVMVLPSVQEGLALVQAQAMACRCPVIASPHTGSGDLFSDGVEGFITPVRDVDAIASRLQQLADNPPLRDRMAAAALQHTRSIGGWNQYGERMTSVFSSLVNH